MRFIKRLDDTVLSETLKDIHPGICMPRLHAECSSGRGGVVPIKNATRMGSTTFHQKGIAHMTRATTARPWKATKFVESLNNRANVNEQNILSCAVENPRTVDDVCTVCRHEIAIA